MLRDGPDGPCISPSVGVPRFPAPARGRCRRGVVSLEAMVRSHLGALFPGGEGGRGARLPGHRSGDIQLDELGTGELRSGDR